MKFTVKTVKMFYSSGNVVYHLHLYLYKKRIHQTLYLTPITSKKYFHFLYY